MAVRWAGVPVKTHRLHKALKKRVETKMKLRLTPVDGIKFAFSEYGVQLISMQFAKLALIINERLETSIKYARLENEG